jgi:hypothetical protein
MTALIPIKLTRGHPGLPPLRLCSELRTVSKGQCDRGLSDHIVT